MASSHAASPGAAGRPLTDFEQVLFGVIAAEPRSGYGLKKMFSSSPASVYQPSPGALYPALRRLEERGLLHAEKQVSRGRRALRLYQVTEAGLAVYLECLRKPVIPETVGAGLGKQANPVREAKGGLERADAGSQPPRLGVHAPPPRPQGAEIPAAAPPQAGAPLATIEVPERVVDPGCLPVDDAGQPVAIGK